MERFTANAVLDQPLISTLKRRGAEWCNPATRPLNASNADIVQVNRTPNQPLTMPTPNKSSKKEEIRKAQKEEVRLGAKMKEQKRAAGIEAIHKVSGFTTYIRRAHGSYGGKVK